MPVTSLCRQVQFQKHQNLLGLSTVQTFDITSIAEFMHAFNSGVRSHGHNTFALQQTYPQRINAKKAE